MRYYTAHFLYVYVFRHISVDDVEFIVFRLIDLPGRLPWHDFLQDSGSEAAEEALDYDRLPPKPLAAKAAESVIVAAMTEEQRQLEKE